VDELEKIFDGLPATMSVDEAAKVIGWDKMTFYDMKYRPVKYGFPPNMLYKDGVKLRVVTSVFKKWWLGRIKFVNDDDLTA
jgi:inorganic pyrophosphatase